MHLLLIAVVVEEDGVHIAIAGVEDVGDGQAVLFADFVDALEDFGEFAAGDAGVLGAVGVGDSANGAEGGFAGFPQGSAAVGVGGSLAGDGAVGVADGADFFHLGVEEGFDAVKLDEDHGLGFAREAEVEGIFDDLDHGAVEHFHGGGEMTGGNDFGDPRYSRQVKFFASSGSPVPL